MALTKSITEPHKSRNANAEQQETNFYEMLNRTKESLGETQETDGVDDGEGEHVSGDHLEDHRHEGSSQLDCSTEEHQVEPGSRDAEDEKSFL